MSKLAILVIVIMITLTGCKDREADSKQHSQKVTAAKKICEKELKEIMSGIDENSQYYYENSENLDFAEPFIVYIPEYDIQDEMYMFPVYDMITKRIVLVAEVFSAKGNYYCNFSFSYVDILNQLKYIDEPDSVIVYRIGLVVYFDKHGRVYDGGGVEIISDIDSTSKEKKFLLLSFEEKKKEIQVRLSEL